MNIVIVEYLVVEVIVEEEFVVVFFSEVEVVYCEDDFVLVVVGIDDVWWCVIECLFVGYVFYDLVRIEVVFFCWYVLGILNVRFVYGEDDVV